MDSGKISKVFLVFLILGLIPFSASVSEVDVLVVNDGHELGSESKVGYEDGMFEERYRTALESVKGVDVTFTNTTEDETGPSYERMSDYDAVVWYTLGDQDGTGPGYVTLTEQDEQNVRRYLNNGGSMFLTGHNLDNSREGLRGEESLFRDWFSVRFQDEIGNAPSYWRLNYNDKRDNPDKWTGARVSDDLQKVDYQYKLHFGDVGNSFLIGEEDSRVSGGLGFRLNRSLEPATDLGVLSDNCRHEEDYGRLDRCGYADDVLSFANNIPTNGETGKKPDDENNNFNSEDDIRRMTVSYSSSNEPVILGVLNYNPVSSTGIESVRETEGREIRKLSSKSANGARMNTYILKETDGDGKFVIKTENKTNISAGTFNIKDTTEEITVADIATNSKSSGEISTTVESGEGDRVFEFLFSSTQMENEGFAGDNVGDNNAVFRLYENDASPGETTVTKQGGENYIHTAFTVEQKIDKEDSEYYIETGGGQLGTKCNPFGCAIDHPDEKAHSAVSTFRNDYRAVFTSVGFESIAYQDEREKFMKNVLRFFSGPVANQTEIHSGEDIPETDVDESRYTDSMVNIGAKGLNLQKNAGRIVEARYTHNYSPGGLDQAFSSGFENFTEVNDKWVLNSGRYELVGNTDGCGTRFGDSSLMLGDYDDSVSELESSEGVDLSGSQDYEVKFWYGLPGGDCVDAADQGSDKMYLEFYDASKDQWVEQNSYNPSPLSEGEWKVENIEVADRFRDEGFKMRFRSEVDQYVYDAWLIDDVSIDKALPADDGNFDEVSEEVSQSFDASSISGVSDENDGLNVSVGLQFKDNSRQGYWGVTEEQWMIVDTRKPSNPPGLELSDRYVNDGSVNITLKYQVDTEDGTLTVNEGNRADLVRFSCDGSTWSNWEDYNNSKTEQTFSNVPISSERLGCSSSDGNKTVKVDVRDYAGNKPDSDVETWVVYDTEKPDFIGSKPSNQSAVQPEKTLNITATDEFGLPENTESEDASLYNYLNQDDANNTFLPNQTLRYDSSETVFSNLEPGEVSILSYIRDKASNVNKKRLDYDVDNESPQITVIPENSREEQNKSAVKSSYEFRLIAEDKNFDTITVNNGSNQNVTFEDNASWVPGWDEGESRPLNIWANDTAGNERYSYYSFTVDDTAPVLESTEVADGSYVRPGETLGFDFSDALSSVAETEASRPSYEGQEWDLIVDPEWSTGRGQEVELNATDLTGGDGRPGNLLQQSRTYDVDGISPEASTNYSRSSLQVDGWTDSNVTLTLNASDNMALSEISYDVESEDGDRSLDETVGSNTTLEVGCEDGGQCEKFIVYRALDAAGNPSVDDYNVSDLIAIDKKNPTLSLNRPRNETVSGIVELDVDAQDTGVGLESVEYEVLNSSDRSQVITEGTLQEADEWTDTWDSRTDIDDSEKLVFRVNASDKFLQDTVKERVFTVENQRTTVTVNRPGESIISENFSVNVEANRPGDLDNLAYHNLTITKDGTTYYEENTSLEGQESDGHLYNITDFPVSDLGSDGNYTLNTTASSEGGEYATTETDFYLDTTPPDASISDRLNDSWVNGTLNVPFTAKDETSNGSIMLKYRNETSEWTDLKDLEFSQSSFTFNTERYCQDSEEENCAVKIVVSDSAENINSSYIEFKVDNTPPEVLISSPEARSWQKEDFTVQRAVSDNVLDAYELECDVRINSGEWKDKTSCSQDFTVEVPEDCGQSSDSRCFVDVRASHPVLDLKQINETSFRIDTEKPQIFSGPEPSSGSFINGTEEISLEFEDTLSGIAYSKYDDGKLRNLESGEPFEPSWNSSGQKNLIVKLNDSADNLRTEEYSYTFDDQAPEIKNITLSKNSGSVFSETRVYSGEAIELRLNATDNIEVDKARAEISKGEEKWNTTLELDSGDREQGFWTDNLANESKGLYQVEEIYVEDRAGNRTVRSDSLPEFRVVDFSKDVKLGENTMMTAGNSTALTYDINFNRTNGERNVRLEVPGTEERPYFDFSSLNCENIPDENCGVQDEGSYLNISYNGSDVDITITGGVQSFTPVEDRTGEFVTAIKGNRKSQSVSVNAPDLILENASCTESCTVNQSQAFNVSYDILNNDTSTNSGIARDVKLRLTSNTLDKGAKQLGNLASGESTTETFTNNSITEVGKYEINAQLEEPTGSYSSEENVEIQVKDSTPPRIGELQLGSDRINPNESLAAEVTVEDNVFVNRTKLEITYPDGTEGNISLNRPISGDAWKARFSNTSQTGTYTLNKLYAYDRRGNLNTSTVNREFTVTPLELNVSITGERNITSSEPVNISANISGNSTDVSKIFVDISSPEIDNRIIEYSDVGLENIITIDNFLNSGNHSIEVTAEAGLSASNSTSNVFVQYGESNVRSLAGTHVIEIPEDPRYSETVDLPWRIEALNGSLGDVTLQGVSNDQDVFEFVRERNIGNLTAREESTSEEMALDPSSTGETNISLNVDPGKGEPSSSEEVSIQVVGEDNQNPNITSLNLSEEELNLNEGLSVESYVKDNSLLKNVTLQVTYRENGEKQVYSEVMERTDGERYVLPFKDTVSTGEYNATVKAWDVAGNKDVMNSSFNVTDEYSVEVETDQQVYVKEEDIGLDFTVRDANGERVENYNISAKMERGDVNDMIESVDSGAASYEIDSDYRPLITRDPSRLPMNYRAFVEVNSTGNEGSKVKNIPVTRILDVSINHKEFVAPGEEFKVVTEWTEPLNDPVSGDLNPYILCTRCDSDYKSLIEDPDRGLYIQNLTAPEETGEYDFRVKGSVAGNSEKQNTETDSEPFSTFEVVPGGTPPENTTGGEQGQASGGGGGGFSSGPSMEITRQSPPASVPPETDEVSLSVNTNIAAECAYSRNQIPEAVSFEEASKFENTGGVNHTNSLSIQEGTTYSYSVMCASEEANSTQEVIFSTESLETFTFAAPTSITPGNESVTQFGNSSARIAIYNEKSEPLTVDLGVEGTCCNLSFESGSEEMDSVTIPGDGETNLDLQVYAPLYVEPGSYSGTLTLSSPNENTSRPFNYQVTSHPAVDNFTELETRTGLINSSINEYRIAGIDTSNMRKAFENLTGYLAQADEAIERNDLEGLKTAVSEGRAEADTIRGMLDDASWKKYVLLNWWKWAAIFVAIYILFFLIVMVGIPYYRIQTEITRINSQLETAVEARKKGEKQYFQRKIDKDTFNEMMTERQNEVLQLRGEKEDLKEELDGFLMDKLTVENYLKAPWKGMNELEKWWAANRKARENLNQDDEQEEE